MSLQIICSLKKLSLLWKVLQMYPQCHVLLNDVCIFSDKRRSNFIKQWKKAEHTCHALGCLLLPGALQQHSPRRGNAGLLTPGASFSGVCDESSYLWVGGIHPWRKAWGATRLPVKGFVPDNMQMVPHCSILTHVDNRENQDGVTKTQQCFCHQPRVFLVGHKQAPHRMLTP